MGSHPPIPEPRSPLSVPEVLSPEGSYVPPQPVRKPKPSWVVAPATYVLIGINGLVFLLMVAHRISPFSPTPEQLLYFGANNAGSVLINGEWSRIVKAMFIHVGFIHLATNMWCLWNLGMLAEPLLGSAGVAAAYILSGAAGNLLSVFVTWTWPIFLSWIAPGRDLGGATAFPVGAGASGAVFGLAGVLIVLLKSPRLPVPAQELARLRKSVIYFAAINLLIGVATMAPGFGVHIDNMAHLGGFGCGLLFAAPLVPRLGSPRKLFEMRRRISVGMVVAVLVLFGFFLAQLPG